MNDTTPAVKKMIDGIPRRIRLDLMTPAELAITEAMKAVEVAGAHVLLTEAVILLQQSRDKVAEYVDQQGELQPRAPETAATRAVGDRPAHASLKDAEPVTADQQGQPRADEASRASSSPEVKADEERCAYPYPYCGEPRGAGVHSAREHSHSPHRGCHPFVSEQTAPVAETPEDLGWGGPDPTDPNNDVPGDEDGPLEDLRDLIVSVERIGFDRHLEAVREFAIRLRGKYDF